jgi:capsular polysaccharide biosynthesis protein
MYPDKALIEVDPRIRTVDDVLYLPSGREAPNERAWGIYEHGKLILDTAYVRDGVPVMQDARVEAPEPVARDNQVYVYGGLMHSHFGHFLLSSLSRYWNAYRGFKYLVHGNISPKFWFQHPPVGDCLRALGLTEDNFVLLTAPTRLRRLIVPAPSFIEESIAHRTFGRLGAQVGRTLAGALGTSTDRPVYLTKLNRTSGVWRYTNEADLVERLIKGGVEIIVPEDLPLAEQIRLLQSRPILSPMGSAHHLSIFAWTPCKITVLSYSDQIHANFPLLDRVKGNDSRYVLPPGGVERRFDDPNFHVVMHMQDPVGCAEALLRAVDR